MTARRADWWIISAVLVHLLITILHGRAHDGGHVSITRSQALFVYSVILAAPLAGMAVSFVAPRAGGFIVAVSMGASLLFGLINHFIVISPDHVSQVASDWRSLFTATAVLLVVSEAAGVIAGLRTVVGREVWS